MDFSGDMTEAYRWMTDGLLAMRNVYELFDCCAFNASYNERSHPKRGRHEIRDEKT